MISLIACMILLGQGSAILGNTKQNDGLTVCGGNLRDSPSVTGSRHPSRRTLRIISRSLHTAKDLSEDILSYYVTDMHVIVDEISLIETTCASSIVPDINEDATSSKIMEELPTDYGHIINVLSAVRFVKSRTNDVHQTNSLLRLENNIQDLLCTLNIYSLESGILLPRQIHLDDVKLPEAVDISGLMASCNVNTSFNRRQINWEILRLSKDFFGNLFEKYINHSRSL